MAKKNNNPTIAPGTDNLEKRATPEDVAEGNTTKFTSLSFDEVDPSEDPDEGRRNR